MSKEIIYIDYDEALNIYGKMIDASDGGFEGVRDEGGIRAALDFVQRYSTKPDSCLRMRCWYRKAASRIRKQ